MKYKTIAKTIICSNSKCIYFRLLGKENIILHSFYKTRQWRRRRYRCKECGKTFSSTYGTAYYRLQSARVSFDKVTTMSVNGIDKSSIFRIKNLSWDTIERWLERASKHAHHFNHRYLKGYEITEVQADEIRTFVDSKLKVTWLFTAIEVSTRLWISMVAGKRTYQNVKMCLCQFLRSGRVSVPFLFTTDGFDMYRWFVQRYLKGIAIYGQIIKKRSVDRTPLNSTKAALTEALLESEDSHTLNTSFVERHNLIIQTGMCLSEKKDSIPCKRYKNT
jgi:transposase-like protein/IS1 family transposase